MILDFYNPSNINNLRRNKIINISINENFYQKIKSKAVKFSNLLTPIPNNFVTSSPILLPQ